LFKKSGVFRRIRLTKIPHRSLLARIEPKKLRFYGLHPGLEQAGIRILPTANQAIEQADV
jgi:hypothetical protein